MGLLPLCSRQSACNCMAVYLHVWPLCKAPVYGLTSADMLQDALAKLQAGRTTLVIAHRLSTIRDASSIAVVQVRIRMACVYTVCASVCATDCCLLHSF